MVAFSNGSLLQGFGYRLAKRQPLAVPRRHPALLHLASRGGGAGLHRGVPDPGQSHWRCRAPMRNFSCMEDASEYWGLRPERYADERRARNDVERLARKAATLLTPLDTSGETVRGVCRRRRERDRLRACGISALRHVPAPPPRSGCSRRHRILGRRAQSRHSKKRRGECHCRRAAEFPSCGVRNEIRDQRL